jgi:hypothetical protein
LLNESDSYPNIIAVVIISLNTQRKEESTWLNQI